jgi:hypothetical protein
MTKRGQQIPEALSHLASQGAARQEAATLVAQQGLSRAVS